MLFLAGLLASSIHLEHLAVITPFALSRSRNSWLIGLFWALGHTVGMASIFGLVALGGVDLHDHIGHDLEHFAAGSALIVIGAYAFLQALKRKKSPMKRSSPKKATLWGISFWGLGHSFVCIPHWMALLPSLAYSATERYGYLLGFSCGMLLTMTLYTLLLGRVSLALSSVWFKYLSLTIGMIIVLLGVVMLGS